MEPAGAERHRRAGRQAERAGASESKTETLKLIGDRLGNMDEILTRYGATSESKFWVRASIEKWSAMPEAAENADS